MIELVCTVIRFVSNNAKFGICTVVGLNGTLIEAKIRTWDTWMGVFTIASKSVTFRPLTVQMPNLELIGTKWITVMYYYYYYYYNYISFRMVFYRISQARRDHNRLEVTNMEE
jgi:hypothetical protein